MRSSRKLTVSFVGLLCAFAVLLACARARYPDSRETLEARGALVRMLSVASLAQSGDCISARNLLEGINGCLGDVPGGYCYHDSCDVVCAPDFQEADIFIVTVIPGEAR